MLKRMIRFVARFVSFCLPVDRLAPSAPQAPQAPRHRSGPMRRSWRPMSRRRKRWSTACWRSPRSQKSDFVVDLGCGDGRIPVTAAKKYGARGLGVDIDPVRIAEANANAKAAGVEHLVDVQAAGRAEDRRLQRHRRDHLLAVGVEPAAAPDPHQAAEARLAHRHALVQHGRLGAGQDPRRSRTPTGRSRTIYLYLADGKVRQ